MRRLRFAVARRFGARLAKSQQIHLVQFGAQRYKRVVFRDAYLSSQVERNFEGFGPSPHFPGLVIRYENELWVEYIDGSAVGEPDAVFAGKVADFYAALYTRAPRELPISALPFTSRLQQDLRFLGQVGVLDAATHADLSATARGVTPAHVWVGYDYLDPVLKNLIVRRDLDVVCAIDVESLHDGQLMGFGAAKALLRWLGPWREPFFARLVEAGAPDIRPHLAFIELCFLARWTKRNFLEGKWRSVDPRLFDRFRALG